MFFSKISITEACKSYFPISYFEKQGHITTSTVQCKKNKY